MKTNWLVIAYFSVAVIVAVLVTSCAPSHHIKCDAYGQVSSESNDTACK